jgi:four helix bundle protein
MTEKRKKVERFENLLVWQKGMETVKQVYLISREDDLGRDFALWDQLRQAAISIPTNIAEGFGRSSRQEYVNFLNYANSSTGEVRILLNLAFELGYLKPSKHEELRNAVMELSHYLSNQIKALRSCNS